MMRKMRNLQSTRHNIIVVLFVLCVMCSLVMKTDVSAVTLTGSSNAEKVFNYFSTHGYTPQAAAAVTANLIWESGGGTSLNIYLHTEEVTSNPNKGIGMVQWTGDRRTAFEKYCISKGTIWTNSTLELQMDYLLYELNSGSQWSYPSSVYGATYSKYNKSFAQFKSLTDIDVATGAFCFCFERPNAAQSGITSRIANAKRVLETFSSKIDTEKPSNVTLALEKTTFLSTDHVTYYCSGNNVNYYVISIYDSTGKVLETIKVYPGEYATRYYNPGKYIVYCEGFNSKGNTFSNTINFTVNQAEKPSNVMLALEKNIFLSRDHVTYYCYGDNVNYYVISIYDSTGKVLETIKVNPGEYATRYYNQGKYIVYCEGFNSIGNTFSNTIEFIVCDHLSTELRGYRAASCTAVGYSGDIYCKNCKTKISSGKQIAKLNHKYDKGVITRSSSNTVTGIKTYTCTVCKATKTETIPTTGIRNNQTISANCYIKKIGDSAFSIGAKTSGNGTLTYSSDKTSVAIVSSNGKVTIKGVGIANIKITAAATSTYNKATKTITVTVNPKSTTLYSLKNSSKKKMKITWKRNSAVTGYRIQIATNSKFTNAKIYTIKSNKTLTKTISVTKGKTYYVRIRTYKGSLQSSWSAVKKLKIKK